MAKASTKIKETPAMTKTVTAAAGALAAAATVAHVGDLVYDRALLAQVAVGTDSEAASALIPAASATKLIDLDLVTYNPAGPDANGMLQVALSPKGREAYTFDQSEEGQDEAKSNGAKRQRTKSDIATPTNFSISTVPLPIPDHVRGTRGNELYPFRELDLGHSFHIPTENEKVQEVIAGRVTSSISTANSRYFDLAHPVGGATGARFLARKVGADDPAGLGVRVWRIENLTAEGRAEIIAEQAETKRKADEAAALKAAAGATAEAPPAV